MPIKFPTGKPRKKKIIEEPVIPTILGKKAEPKEPPHGLSGSVPLGFRSPPGDSEVVTVQVSEDIYGSLPSPTKFAVDLLIDELRRGFEKLPEDEEWVVWVGERIYHPRGLTFWVGFSPNIPSDIPDSLYDVFRMFGVRTGRGTAIPDQHGLAPILWLGEEGLELLRMF